MQLDAAPVSGYEQEYGDIPDAPISAPDGYGGAGKPESSIPQTMTKSLVSKPSTPNNTHKP